MKRDFVYLRVLLCIALVALPLILVAATLEPLERSPARAGRNAVTAPQDAPDTTTDEPAATP